MAAAHKSKNAASAQARRAGHDEAKAARAVPALEGGPEARDSATRQGAHVMRVHTAQCRCARFTQQRELPQEVEALVHGVGARLTTRALLAHG